MNAANSDNVLQHQIFGLLFMMFLFCYNTDYFERYKRLPYNWVQTLCDLGNHLLEIIEHPNKRLMDELLQKRPK